MNARPQASSLKATGIGFAVASKLHRDIMIVYHHKVCTKLFSTLNGIALVPRLYLALPGFTLIDFPIFTVLFLCPCHAAGNDVKLKA